MDSENKGYQPDSHNNLRYFCACKTAQIRAHIFDTESCRQGSHPTGNRRFVQRLVAYLDDRILCFLESVIVITICATCGKAIHVKPSRLGAKNFCSMACYGLSRNLQKELNCFVCGKPVRRKPSRIDDHVFCSMTCLGVFHSGPKTQVQSTCEYCGKVFGVQPARKARSRYCSRRCKDAARIGKPHPTMQKVRVEKQCAFCGQCFFVKTSHVDKRHCCSRKCFGLLRGKNALGFDPTRRVEKACIVCGKSFLVKLSHAERAGTYCSKECMTIDYQSRFVGDANPNYRHGQGASTPPRREWVRIRKSDEGVRNILDLMRIQQGRCVYCQADIRSEFEVDHRIPLSRGGSNRIGNLQLACPDCNRQKNRRFHIEFLVWRKRQKV